MTNEIGNVEQSLNLDNDDSLPPSEMLRTICDIKLPLLLHIKNYMLLLNYTLIVIFCSFVKIQMPLKYLLTKKKFIAR